MLKFRSNLQPMLTKQNRGLLADCNHKGVSEQEKGSPVQNRHICFVLMLWLLRITCSEQREAHSDHNGTFWGRKKFRFHQIPCCRLSQGCRPPWLTRTMGQTLGPRRPFVSHQVQCFYRNKCALCVVLSTPQLRIGTCKGGAGACTAPIIAVFIPGTPLKTTRLQKRA